MESKNETCQSLKRKYPLFYAQMVREISILDDIYELTSHVLDIDLWDEYLCTSKAHFDKFVCHRGRQGSPIWRRSSRNVKAGIYEPKNRIRLRIRAIQQKWDTIIKAYNNGISADTLIRLHNIDFPIETLKYDR